MKTKLTPILENKAVELYAHNPNIKHSEVAEQLDINPKTLFKLRKQPQFWEKVYGEFMIHFEAEIPDVIRAMIREAKHGNVQAGRLMLEFGNKLSQRLEVNVVSPFEKWLIHDSKDISSTTNIQSAEIVKDILPDRIADNSHEAVEEEFAKLDKELIQKKASMKRRRELYSWSKRAELVGIAPLPPRRPTKGQRIEWEMSIIRAEQELGIGKS